MGADLQNRVESLTVRQLECLAGVARHLRTEMIAHELGLSTKTVDAHIAGALKRLGVFDRDSAVRLLCEAAQMPWGKSLTGFSPIAAQGERGPVGQLSRLPWPWPTQRRPENDLGAIAKLLLIFAIAAVMMGAAAAYIAAVIGISSLF